MYFLWTPKESTKERRRYFRGAGHGKGDCEVASVGPRLSVRSRGASNVRPGGENNRTSESAMPTGGARCAPPSGRPFEPQSGRSRTGGTRGIPLQF